MELLYFVSGFALGTLSSYLWFMIGRNTGYQDKNIIPPPSPTPIVTLPTVDIFNRPKKENPPGWVDDLHDPSMVNFEKGREL